MPNSPRGAPQGARIPQRILLGGSNIARLFCVGVPKTGEARLFDASFFGLSLWMEWKVANCACASGWSCLMNLDLIHFSSLSIIILIVPFVCRTRGAYYVPKVFNTLTKTYTQGHFACLYHVCSYRLRA